MANKVIIYQVNFQGNTGQLKSSLQSLQQDLKNLTSTPIRLDDGTVTKAINNVKQLEQHLKAATNVDTGRLDLSKFAQQLKQSNMDLKTYANSLNMLGTQGQTAFLKLAQSIAAGQGPLRRTNKLMAELWTTMKNTMRWQLTSSLLTGFTSAISTAVGYAKDLDKSLNDIRIVSGQSAASMDAFAERANKAAKALSASTLAYTDAAKIYYQQGDLGTKAIEERTEATIKMSNVTGDSAEEVSSYMTAIWNNFDKGSKSLEYFADVMAKLGAETAASTSEIATGLEKFAGIAETVGLSYEYATSALATLVAETRQSPETVGTALKTIFSRLQGLSLGETLEDGTTLNKYSEALAVVGVQIKEQDGSLKDMDKILDELGRKWVTLAEDQKMALAQTVGGVRQYTQLITLMDNYKDFKVNVDLAVNAEGTLDEQQKIFEDGWEASSKRVRVSLEQLYSQLIDKDMFTDVNNMLSGLLDSVSGVIKGFGGIGNVLLPVFGMLASKLMPSLIQGSVNFFTNLKNSAGFTNQITQSMLTQVETQLQSSNITKNSNTNYETIKSNTLEILRLEKERISLSGSLTQEQTEFLNKKKEELILENQILEKQGKRVVESQNWLKHNASYNIKSAEGASKEQKKEILEASQSLYKASFFNRQLDNSGIYREDTSGIKIDTDSIASGAGDIQQETEEMKQAAKGMINYITGQLDKTRQIFEQAGMQTTVDKEGNFTGVKTKKISDKEQYTMDLGAVGIYGVDGRTKAVQQFQASYAQRNKISKDTALEKIKELKKKYDDLSPAEKKAAEQAYRYRKALDDVNKSVKNMNDKLKDSTKILKDEKTDMETLKKTVDELEKEYKEASGSVLDFGEQLNREANEKADDAKIKNTERGEIVAKGEQDADETQVYSRQQEALKELNQAEQNLHTARQERTMGYQQMLGGVTSALSGMAMMIQSIQSLGSIWTNDDLSTGEKIVSTIMTMSMALGSLGSITQGVTAITTGFNLVKKSGQAIDAAIMAQNKAEIALRTIEIAQEKKCAIETAKTISMEELEYKKSQGHIVGNVFHGLSKELKKGFPAMLPGIAAIGLVAAAIGVGIAGAVGAASKQNNAEQFEKDYGEAQEINETASSNQEQVSSYNSLIHTYKETGKRKEELKKQSLELAKAYQIEGAALDILNDDYDSFNEKLKKAQKKENESVVAKNKTAAKSFAQVLKDENTLEGIKNQTSETLFSDLGDVLDNKYFKYVNGQVQMSTSDTDSAYYIAEMQRIKTEMEAKYSADQLASDEFYQTISKNLFDIGEDKVNQAVEINDAIENANLESLYLDSSKKSANLTEYKKNREEFINQATKNKEVTASQAQDYYDNQVENQDFADRLALIKDLSKEIDITGKHTEQVEDEILKLYELYGDSVFDITFAVDENGSLKYSEDYLKLLSNELNQKELLVKIGASFNFEEDFYKYVEEHGLEEAFKEYKISIPLQYEFLEGNEKGVLNYLQKRTIKKNIDEFNKTLTTDTTKKDRLENGEKIGIQSTATARQIQEKEQELENAKVAANEAKKAYDAGWDTFNKQQLIEANKDFNWIDTGSAIYEWNAAGSLDNSRAVEFAEHLGTTGDAYDENKTAANIAEKMEAMYPFLKDEYFEDKYSMYNQTDQKSYDFSPREVIERIAYDAYGVYSIIGTKKYSYVGEAVNKIQEDINNITKDTTELWEYWDGENLTNRVIEADAEVLKLQDELAILKNDHLMELTPELYTQLTITTKQIDNIELLNKQWKYVDRSIGNYSEQLRTIVQDSDLAVEAASRYIKDYEKAISDGTIDKEEEKRLIQLEAEITELHITKQAELQFKEFINGVFSDTEFLQNYDTASNPDTNEEEQEENFKKIAGFLSSSLGIPIDAESFTMYQDDFENLLFSDNITLENIYQLLIKLSTKERSESDIAGLLGIEDLNDLDSDSSIVQLLTNPENFTISEIFNAIKELNDPTQQVPVLKDLFGNFLPAELQEQIMAYEEFTNLQAGIQKDTEGNNKTAKFDGVNYIDMGVIADPTSNQYENYLAKNARGEYVTQSVTNEVTKEKETHYYITQEQYDQMAQSKDFETVLTNAASQSSASFDNSPQEMTENTFRSTAKLKTYTDNIEQQKELAKTLENQAYELFPDNTKALDEYIQKLKLGIATEEDYQKMINSIDFDKAKKEYKEIDKAIEDHFGNISNYINEGFALDSEKVQEEYADIAHELSDWLDLEIKVDANFVYTYEDIIKNYFNNPSAENGEKLKRVIGEYQIDVTINMMSDDKKTRIESETQAAVDEIIKAAEDAETNTQDIADDIIVNMLKNLDGLDLTADEVAKIIEGVLLSIPTEITTTWKFEVIASEVVKGLDNYAAGKDEKKPPSNTSYTTTGEATETTDKKNVEILRTDDPETEEDEEMEVDKTSLSGAVGVALKNYSTNQIVAAIEKYAGANKEGNKENESEKGGGGGKKDEKDEPTPPDPKVRKFIGSMQRLTEVMERLSREYSNLEKMSDEYLATDEERLNRIIGLNENLEEQLKTQNALRAEAEIALPKARAEMQRWATGLNLEYDIDGRVLNSALIEQNFDHQIAAASTKEAQEAIEDQKSKALDAIQSYNEIVDMMNETEETILDIAISINKNALELITLPYELIQKAREKEQEHLEEYLSWIEEVENQSATRILYLGQEMSSLSEQWAGNEEKIVQLYATGLTTQAQRNAMEEALDERLKIRTKMLETQQQVIEQIGIVLEDWSKNIDKILDKFERINSLIDTYSSVLEVISKTTKEFQDASLSLSDAQIKNNKVQLQSAKETMEAYEIFYNQVKREYETALASGDEIQIQLWKNQIESVEEKLNEATDNFRDAWTNTLNIILERYELAVKQSISRFEDSLSPKKTLDEKNDLYTKTAEISDRFLSNEERIYELNKMNRQINQQISKDANILTQQKLLGIQKIINELQENEAKLTDYQLSKLQKIYDLRLAEIALEEAQNNKSQARLVRNSQGNWNYVFTANQNQLDQAAQQLEDARYAYNTNAKQQVDNISKGILDNEKALSDALSELKREDYETEEDFRKALQETSEYYLKNDEYLRAQLDEALKDAGMRYKDSNLGKIDEFDTIQEGRTNLVESTEKVINEMVEHFINFEKEVEETMSQSGMLYDNFTTDLSNSLVDIENWSTSAGSIISEQCNNMVLSIGSVIQEIQKLTESGALLTDVVDFNELIMQSTSKIAEKIYGYTYHSGTDYLSAAIKIYETYGESAKELIMDVVTGLRNQKIMGGHYSDETGDASILSSDDFWNMVTSSASNIGDNTYIGNLNDMNVEELNPETQQAIKNIENLAKFGGVSGVNLDPIYFQDLNKNGIRDLDEVLTGVNAMYSPWEQRKYFKVEGHETETPDGTYGSLQHKASSVAELTQWLQAGEGGGTLWVQYNGRMYESKLNEKNEVMILPWYDEEGNSGKEIRFVDMYLGYETLDILRHVDAKEGEPENMYELVGQPDKRFYIPSYNLSNEEDIYPMKIVRNGNQVTYVDKETGEEIDVDALLKKTGAYIYNPYMETYVLYTGTESFDTGGYTGDWNSSEGRLAMLHEKEIVLNKADTKNLLSAVEVLRGMSSNIAGMILGNAGAQMTGLSRAITTAAISSLPTLLQQEVHIDASFPGVTSAQEIENALNNIVNDVAQYAEIKKL